MIGFLTNQIERKTLRTLNTYDTMLLTVWTWRFLTTDTELVLISWRKSFESQIKNNPPLHRPKYKRGELLHQVKQFSMSNLQKHQDVKRIMENVSNAAPFALLLMAIGTFLAVGIFRTDYYTEIFAVRLGGISALSMAIFVAILEEGVRLALLISSVRDFSDRRKGNGWLGLIGSVALVAYEIQTSIHVAGMWASEGAATLPTYRTLLIFLILTGLLLEIRLILTIPGASLGKPPARNGQAKENWAVMKTS